MRWVVEVIALGKTETESLQVDAESWQKALQAARTQRGESAPMSGFSIELLDDGCRAVDPKSRVRYDVRRAPPEPAPGAASLSSRPPNVQPPSSVAAPVQPLSSVAPPAPVQPTVSRAAPQPSQAAPSSGAPRTSQPPRAGKRKDASSRARGPVEPVSTTPIIQAAVIPPTVASNVAPPVAPAAAHSTNARSGGEPSVHSQVIFKREHEATDSVPLTYREYVFLVPTGTTEEAAEALLRAQLDMVLASLARAPAGKLVNLGIFDVAFRGKPAIPPLATLMWKDWRGSPTIEFPRRRRSTAHSSPPTPLPVVIAEPPPPARDALDPLPVASTTTPPPPASRPAPAPSTATPLAPIAAPVLPPVRIAAIAIAPIVITEEPRPMEVSRRSANSEESVAPPVATAPGPRARVPAEELIADLFDSMHELHFLRDAIEGGDFCLNLAMEKIPSQAGIVHLYDINRREFVVTSTRGAAASPLLLRRHPEGDALLSAAMGKRRAIVLADATDNNAALLERYAALGGARSLIVVPVMQSGRFLGAIELVNPLDGEPYTEAEGNALTYIAEQFAEFVASRGVVTDPARITSRAG